jgi:hypothetical protein
MDVVFSVEDRLFAVFRDADGSLHWSDYDGKKVIAAFPSDDGTRCVLLLARYPTSKPRFENLFCIDRSGKKVWIAELPQTHDRFMEAHMEPDGLHAGSWSSYWIVFDPADGHIISQEFTK